MRHRHRARQWRHAFVPKHGHPRHAGHALGVAPSQVPRSSSDAIDRSSAFERNLGSGISSCDGPTAIFVFNRGTETSTVLTGIDAVAKAHGNFKRAVTWPHESGVRYVLHTSGDKNRELVLTVLVFHVPM